MRRVSDPDMSRAIADAMAARAAGNLLRAISAYRRAIVAGQAAGDRSGLAIAHDNLGNLLADLGQFDEAIENYDEALKNEDDRWGVSSILSNKARVFGEIGWLRKAASMQQQRVVELEMAGSEGEGLLAVALDNAASMFSKLGEQARARELLERANKLLEQHGDLRARAVNALSRSNIHVALGELSKAGDAFRAAHQFSFDYARATIGIERYRQGFLIAQRTSLSPTHPVHQLFDIGVQQKNRGQWPAAIATWQSAEAVAREAGDLAFALRIAANRAATLSDWGRVEPSIAIIQQVRDEASTNGLARPEMMVMGTLAARIMDGADVSDPGGAIGLYAGVVTLADIHRQVVSECRLPPEIAAFETQDTGAVSAQLAKLALSHHDYDLAVRYSTRAVELAWSIYRSFVQNTSKGGTPLIPAELPNRLAGLLVAAEKGGRADVAEDAAKNLAALLERKGMVPRGRLVAHRALADHIAKRDPAGAIGHYQRACTISEQMKQQVPVGEGRADVAREHGDVFQKLARLLRVQGNAAAAFEAAQGIKARRLLETVAARTKKSDSPPRLADAIALLDGIGGAVPTVLVDMVVEPEGFTAYIVDAKGVCPVHIAADLAAVGRVDAGDLRERSQRLIRYCLEDRTLADFVKAIAGCLPASCRLLIAASDLLANLPLHIVPLNGKPWCTHFPISFIPCIGALAHLTPELRLGDPVIVAGDARGDLPRASAECESIGAMFGTEPLIGANCSMATLVSSLSLRPHMLLHLAVHGRGDSRRGRRGSLQLADEAGKPQWVDTNALFSQTTDARIVVLSGCSTAVAGPVHGFELTGIARSAAEAGASTVVACLWPVEDAVAERFMVAFYDSVTGQKRRGEIDFVAAFDEARAKLRTWLGSTTVPREGQRRDGRDIALSEDEIDESVELTSDAILDAQMWAPFVLIGRPVLRALQS